MCRNRPEQDCWEDELSASAPVRQDSPVQPAGSPTEAIACESLSKGFDGVPVLRDISVRFMAGTVNVLAGENGAGKSTLFKLISGQLTPDGGALSLHGTPIRRFYPKGAQTHGVS